MRNFMKSHCFRIVSRRVSSLFNSVGSSHLLGRVAAEVMEAPWESVVETVAQAMSSKME